MTESRRRPRSRSSPAAGAGEETPGPELPGTPVLGNGLDAAPSGPGTVTSSELVTNSDSVPAAEAEADAGTDAIWDAYDQTLAAAVRERDRALDRATARLASVTAGGYLEYDRSVSVAMAAFESAWHNARAAVAAAPR